MALPPDLSILSSSEKDALIGALLTRVDVLIAEGEALKMENTRLREQLQRPAKTPQN